MKHSYITCDCCGGAINEKQKDVYKIRRHGLVFGPFYPTWGSRIDICAYCWRDIQDYVKEKRNATMA